MTDFLNVGDKFTLEFEVLKKFDNVHTCDAKVVGTEGGETNYFLPEELIHATNIKRKCVE